MTRGRDYLGSYRYVRLIRAGATCQVWEVAHEDTGKRFALKVLQPEHMVNKEEIQHLRHEYEVGKDLRHPNAVEIYEFNTDREVAFLVLELILGKNLKLTLRQGVAHLEPHMTKIIEQAAEGLKYFHERGWVHRDVKPDNFLLTDDWKVKLIDFAIAQRPATGLAKLLGSRSKLQGTRSYMSPEQIRNEGLDIRADIYSFGCMLYELVTAKMPYTGITSDDLLAKHLRAPIPTVLSLNAQCTNEFAELVMRMMGKRREERPKSMEDFLKLFRAMRVFKAKRIT